MFGSCNLWSRKSAFSHANILYFPCIILSLHITQLLLITKAHSRDKNHSGAKFYTDEAVINALTFTTCLADLSQNGKLTPGIDQYCPLAQTATTIACYEEGHEKAKVIIDILN